MDLAADSALHIPMLGSDEADNKVVTWTRCACIKPNYSRSAPRFSLLKLFDASEVTESALLPGLRLGIDDSLKSIRNSCRSVSMVTLKPA